jgi:antitoxin component of MazEF toxin-antitoxin module
MSKNTKKASFPARVNANLGVRIPEAARKQLKIDVGSLVTVTIEGIEE